MVLLQHNEQTKIEKNFNSIILKAAGTSGIACACCLFEGGCEWNRKIRDTLALWSNPQSRGRRLLVHDTSAAGAVLILATALFAGALMRSAFGR